MKHKLTDYYECYDEACKLANEASEAISDNRRATDTARISQFLAGNEFAAQVVADLSSPDYNRRMYDAVNKYDKEAEATKCLGRLNQASQKSELRKAILRRYISAGTAAAAVVAVMWLILPVHIYKHEATSELMTRNVSLILPDGQIVDVYETNDDHAHLVDGKEATIRKEHHSIVVEKKTEAVDADQPLSYTTLDVPQGFQQKITLEDGTRVWLNSGSTLRFPSTFAANERKVYLEGEAYFEVTRNSRKPFIVEAQEQTLTVLGTAFNLYAYKEEPVIYAALLSGSVEVRVGEKIAILMPNQYSELTRNNGTIDVKTMDVSAVADWRKGVFIFDNNTLEQVIMKISRGYDVEIEFDRQKARDFVYKGNLPKYESIDEMLRNIEMTGSVKFKKEMKKYIMTM